MMFTDLLYHFWGGTLKYEKNFDVFDPNAPALNNGNYFGLPHGVEDATVVILPVPWEVTASGGSGASYGPAAILEASRQVDLGDEDISDAWKPGFALLRDPAIPVVKRLNDILRPRAIECMRRLDEGDTAVGREWKEINKASVDLNSWVRGHAQNLLSLGKIVGVVGGDHSAPLGLMQALAGREEFSIVHFDAHFDMKKTYQGFEFSHASIMHNALKLPQVKKIVHMGIRSYDPKEFDAVRTDPRRKLFTARYLSLLKIQGTPFARSAHDIVQALPTERVYISFDIDGMDPTHCPNTGTPVPGGLLYDEAMYIVQRVAEEKIISAFDVCEVAPAITYERDSWANDYNALVGALVLWRLGTLAAFSQKNK